jgi:hypothetical protein
VPEVVAEPVGDYDEPYVFGQVNPTIDRPGPFTLREYVRLRLLRSRLEEARSTGVQADKAQERPLARR